MQPETSNEVEQDQRGAFRSAAVQPLCKVCGEEAPNSSQCARCGACFCSEHAVLPGERCPDCEGVYVLLEQERRRDPIPRWLLGLGYVLSAAFVTLVTLQFASHPHAAPIILGTFGLAGLWPLYVTLFRRRRVRSRFMREQPGGTKHLPGRRTTTSPSPRAMRVELKEPDAGAGAVVESDQDLELAEVALLTCFLPLLSLAGLVLGIVASVRGGPHPGQAKGAIVVGLVATLVQIGIIVAMID